MVKIVEEKKSEAHAIHHSNPHNSVIFSPQKKGSKLWIFVLIAAVIIIGSLVYFFIFNKPTITTQTLKLQYSLQLGDGTVLKNETAELASGRVASSIGISSKTIDSLVSNMAVGEEKEITLSAADAFGAYDPSMVITINRTSEIKRKSEMNRTFVAQLATAQQVFNEDPVIGKSYATSGSPWEYKVLAIDNSTQMITLSQEAKVGELTQLSEILSMNVTEVTADKITTELVAVEQTLQIPTGNLTVKVAPEFIYFTLTPPVGERIEMVDGSAKVLSFNDTSIVLDYNVDYAGNNVTLKLKLIDKQTVTSAAGYSSKDIPGAPTLDVFVMSYCPYGTQIEKALIPAWKLLREKANLKVRFVSYAMHGDQETQENKLQLCLREETDKFWNYLECFLEAGDSAGCLNKAGVDSAKLNTCISTKADSYWDIDKELNTKYGVQGSPTVVLDGKVIQPDRSPDALKQAVCDAFTSKPSECSQALSTAATSPGFGASASSGSSSSGGCASA